MHNKAYWRSLIDYWLGAYGQKQYRNAKDRRVS